MNLPLSVWLLRGFFAEIEEAARVEGAGGLGIFLQITLPPSAPGTVATGLLAFIFAWNEFLFANVLTGATEARWPAAARAGPPDSWRRRGFPSLRDDEARQTMSGAANGREQRRDRAVLNRI